MAKVTTLAVYGELHEAKVDLLRCTAAVSDAEHAVVVAKRAQWEAERRVNEARAKADAIAIAELEEERKEASAP